ncbi:unnamed protein product (macronuclear) [Paramecium tetraurelia]|uniref:Uncharacterized protein n=1 Tax=Paramecium tetraurelia TaxID=5888 RepID=A0CNM4_PARTE|nr:uncharacterized protein GSPATT00008833001 [Paramecium tetraurelia]CAK72391.1 unnamed protein product [Paramecium tetraurelia]|eukprot:XP_001439788.1 hypothetical protein (macronuclear) [Paramecium tetraurelia strain d4-2]
MSVYIHKAYITKNQCQGDHNYFYHEGQIKQEQQKLIQKTQEENSQIDILQQTIAKQQQIINQLELQNSSYNQTIGKQELQIQSLLNKLQQSDKQKETQNAQLIDEINKLKAILREQQINDQPIKLPEYQEAVMQTEQQQNELILINQSQQVEILYQNQQTQTDTIPAETIVSKESPQKTQPLKLDVKTIRIQPIYYYQT